MKLTFLLFPPINYKVPVLFIHTGTNQPVFPLLAWLMTMTTEQGFPLLILRIQFKIINYLDLQLVTVLKLKLFPWLLYLLYSKVNLTSFHYFEVYVVYC